MQRLHQESSDTMKRTQLPLPVPPSSSLTSVQSNNSMLHDLLWISKQQQQHPSTHAHPLKNTIRVGSGGTRHKFDGKQWRPLCESPDAYECRNLAFRSGLCQKHFYKLHLFKRPYTKHDAQTKQQGLPLTLKRQMPAEYQQHQHHRHTQFLHAPPLQEQKETIEHEDFDDDDDSIQMLDPNDIDSMINRRGDEQLVNESPTEFSFFSIDCDPQSGAEMPGINRVKSEPAIGMRMSSNRTDGPAKRLDSTNIESVVSTSDSSTGSELATPVSLSVPKVSELISLGIPPLTRTEEKALAIELISQLPTNAPLTIGEQMARRRACDMVVDNYAHQLAPNNLSSDWFYDFLLRHPRVPMHFQAWFASVKPTPPSSDQLIEIKMWELGLVTRSATPSSLSSSSP